MPAPTDVQEIRDLALSVVAGSANANVRLLLVTPTGEQDEVISIEQFMLLAAGTPYFKGAPGATLPITADYIGQQFLRTGVTNPGLYRALDLVGNWEGPL